MINLQNINCKKIAMIASFALICVGLAFVLYFLFFKPAPAPLPAAEEIPLGQLPGAKEGEQPGAVTQEVPEAVKPEEVTKSITKIAPEVAPKGADMIAQGGITQVTTLSYEKSSKLLLDSSGNNALTYNPDTGKFNIINPDGTITQLLDKVYKDVKDMALSPQRDKVILEFPDGSNVLFDINQNKQISLPKDWTDFSFNSNGNSIAFKDMNTNKDYRYLGIANADGSNQKYLEYMGDNARDFKIDWSPNGKMIAQYKTGNNATSSKLFFLGQYGENFRSITVDGYSIETKWTPDGSKLMYSSQNAYSEHKPLLHIVDADGDNIGYNHHDLKLYTWANKCAFATATAMYCGVPKELPYGAGLVPAVADNTPDYIYKIDLETGVKSFVAEPEGGYTIDQIQVAGDESNLYFTDKQSGTLHAIQLK